MLCIVGFHGLSAESSQGPGCHSGQGRTSEWFPEGRVSFKHSLDALEGEPAKWSQACVHRFDLFLFIEVVCKDRYYGTDQNKFQTETTQCFPVILGFCLPFFLVV